MTFQNIFSIYYKENNLKYKKLKTMNNENLSVEDAIHLTGKELKQKLIASLDEINKVLAARLAKLQEEQQQYYDEVHDNKQD